MTKKEFLSALEGRLSGLSREDITERLAFYSEAIDDRLEDGLTEEEAVAQLGTADVIAAQIVNDTEQPQKAPKKRRMGALEIVLLVLGSPVWISLLAAFFSVVISLYAAIWSVVIALWATEIALTASFVGCLAGGVVLICVHNLYGGLAALSAGLICGGLAIFAIYGCTAMTKWTAKLTKNSALWIVGLFVRKEGVK